MRTCAVVAIAVMLLSTSAAAADLEPFDRLVADAQTALDTLRPLEARDLFDKALKVAPDKAQSLVFDRAWTFVEPGWLAFEDHDYKTARDLFDEAAVLCPDAKRIVAEPWGFARMKCFWPLLDAADANRGKADWNDLIAYAERTVEVVPDWPESHYALGCAYDRAGLADKASAEYLAAAPNAPKRAPHRALHDAAYKASHRTHEIKPPMYPLLAESDPGDIKVYSDGMFDVHHHNLELGQRTARALRYYLAQSVLDGFLEKTTSLPGVCEVWIYRNHKEFVDARHIDGVVGCALVQSVLQEGSVAGICLEQGMPEMLTETAPHELGHMRFHMKWESNNGASSWIDEGIAVSAEGPVSARARCRNVLDAGDKGKLLPARLLFGTGLTDTGSSADVAYAESFAMVNALVADGGAKHFSGFIDAVHRMDTEAALKMSYGMTPEGLQKLALEWASAKLGDARSAPSSTQANASSGAPGNAQPPKPDTFTPAGPASRQRVAKERACDTWRILLR